MKNTFRLESRIFQSLAHPKRLEILHLLLQKPLSVGEIETMVGISQANVSQHLMVLRKLRLVRSIASRQSRVYELTSPHIADVIRSVRHLLLEHNGVMVEDKLNRLHVHVDPVCGMDVTAHMAAGSTLHEGKRYYFCAKGCEKKFTKAPTHYIEKGQREQLHHSNSAN
jgi:DNA-binding transcriptional ArsR family regulator